MASLPGHGWYVGSTTAGEWLKWNQVFFARETYDVYIRYAASGGGNQVTLSLGGATQTLSLGATGGAFTHQLLAGGFSVSAGTDVQLSFVTGGIDVDFVELVKR